MKEKRAILFYNFKGTSFNMTDDTSDVTESSINNDEEHIILTDDTIAEYCSNDNIITFVRNRFNRLSRVGAINLLDFLLKRHNTIQVSNIIPKYKSFYRHNIGLFNRDKTLKLEVIKSLQRELNGYLHEIGKGLIEYDSNEQKEYIIKVIDGERIFIVNQHTRYKDVRQLICDETDVQFKYNFSKADLTILPPEGIDNLQLVRIQILSKAIKFDYPLEYEYLCTQCINRERRKAYEVVSTNARLQCPGIYHYVDGNGETKSRLCKTGLVPDREISKIKDGFYYDLSYEDEEGNKHSASSFSFNRYLPGFYEAVLFRIKNPKKTEVYQIIDVKEIQNNKFKIPDKKEGENFIFTLQRSMDKFIKKQTGVEIYGMFPIKAALIVQKAASHLDILLRYNLQVIGDASCIPKGTIIKTPEGLKPIEDVKRVLAYDFKTNQIKTSKCINIHAGNKKLIKIYTEKEVIECSYNHKWYVRSKEGNIVEKEAQYLTEDDELIEIE